MATDFKLYVPQQRALVTPAKEVLYGGAAGGGKSYLARVGSIIYSLEIPGLITYLFRRTFKEVLANHVHTPGGYLEMLKGLIEVLRNPRARLPYEATLPSHSSGPTGDTPAICR